MEQYLIPYFTAEKQEALLFILVGMLALAISAALLVKGGAYKGMLYPLAAVAAIQLVVGSTVYLRTDAQVAALTTQYQSDPAGFRASEAQRMDVVVKNFVLYRYIEIALLLTGLGLMGLMRRNELWHAVGIGLSLQAGLMLALDYFAEKRAGEYLQFVLACNTGFLGAPRVLAVNPPSTRTACPAVARVATDVRSMDNARARGTRPRHR